MFKKKKETQKESDLTNLINGSNECPQKEGDNCLVPGTYSDSDPIGGA